MASYNGFQGAKSLVPETWTVEGYIQTDGSGDVTTSPLPKGIASVSHDDDGEYTFTLGQPWVDFAWAGFTIISEDPFDGVQVTAFSGSSKTISIIVFSGDGEDAGTAADIVSGGLFFKFDLKNLRV